MRARRVARGATCAVAAAAAVGIGSEVDDILAAFGVFDVASPGGRATVEDKVGRKMRYSKLMGITTAWENEPSELKKIIQIPLVPLYVIIDLVSAPLLPLINAYELFHNTGVDARRAWYGEG